MDIFDKTYKKDMILAHLFIAMLFQSSHEGSQSGYRQYQLRFLSSAWPLPIRQHMKIMSMTHRRPRALHLTLFPLALLLIFKPVSSDRKAFSCHYEKIK